jgi:dimethyladenosine transferase 1
MNSVRRSLVQAAALGSTQVSKSLPHESSYRLPPLPSLRDLVRIYKLQAIKQLSQNFLLDEKLTSKIVKAAGNLRDHYVCEVGPGPGGITRPIIRRGAKKVVLIERDKRFASSLGMLKEACPAGMVDIYWGDVLSFDMSQMFPDEVRRSWEDITPPIHIIGNLPFSVSTPLIIKWLDAISERRNAWSYGRVPLTLTFQLEVAERLVAEVLNSQRSRLSIMAQHLCHCSHKFTIPGILKELHINV